VIENLREIPKEVEVRIEKDIEPTAEVIGIMSEKMRGKWRGVEQVFHFQTIIELDKLAMKKFFVNPLGIIFCPEIDQKNNFQTIVLNPLNEKIIKVNPFGYEILKIIDETPGIYLQNVIQLVSQKRNEMVWQNEKKIGEFINQMIEENVIFEK